AKANRTVDNIHAQYAVVAPKLAIVLDHVEATVDVLDYSANLPDATLATYKANASMAVPDVAGAVTARAADNSDLDPRARLTEAGLTAADIAVAEAEANLNSAERNVTTSESSLAEAQASLDLKKAGVRPESITAQRAAVSAELAKLEGLQNEKDKRS